MMYTEFTSLTGSSMSEETYHNGVEPSYYNYPGNKYEFCRDWLVDQLYSLGEKMRYMLEMGENYRDNGIAQKHFARWNNRYSTYVSHLADIVGVTA